MKSCLLFKMLTEQQHLLQWDYFLFPMFFFDFLFLKTIVFMAFTFIALDV